MLTQFKQERYTDEATARHFLKQADWNLDRAMKQYMPPVPASPVSDRTFSTSRFKASCECHCHLVHCLIAFASEHLRTPSLRCVDVVTRAPEGPMDLGARFVWSLFSRDYQYSHALAVRLWSSELFVCGTQVQYLATSFVPTALVMTFRGLKRDYLSCSACSASPTPAAFVTPIISVALFSFQWTVVNMLVSVD